MKARIFTTVLLIVFTLTTYAQSNRRSEQDKQKKEQSTSSKQEKRERKADSKATTTKSENTRTYNRSNQSNKSNSQSDQRTTTTNQSNNNQNQRTYNSTNNNDRKEGNDNRYSRQGDDRKDYGNDRRGNESNRRETTHNNNNSRPDKVVVVNNPPARHVTREYVQIKREPRREVVVRHSSGYVPRPVEYRRVHYVYRAPVHRNIVWTVTFGNDFRVFYPEVRYWRYDVGYRIPTISSYDAYDYVGEVAQVYGKVFEVYYDGATDDYFLYFGDYFPYQDFTIIVPGNEARALSRRPQRYFNRAYINVTGYITAYEDKPEIVVRSARQLELY